MKLRWAVPVAVVAVLAAGGVAAASIPDADGTVHACYKKSGGAVRVIDPTVINCSSNETAIEFGAQGEPGIAGTNGTDGVSGYEVVTNVHVVPPGTSVILAHLDVACSAGKKVLGGGGNIGTDAGGITGDDLIKISGPKGDGWQIVYQTGRNPDGDPVNVTVYAFCANVT